MTLVLLVVWTFLMLLVDLWSLSFFVFRHYIQLPCTSLNHVGVCNGWNVEAVYGLSFFLFFHRLFINFVEYCIKHKFQLVFALFYYIFFFSINFIVFKANGAVITALQCPLNYTSFFCLWSVAHVSNCICDSVAWINFMTIIHSFK